MKLVGKTCLITGANSGLGFATAKRFAELGMHVILVCRDATKVEASINAIRKEVPEALLDGLAADLSSVHTVNHLVDEVNRKYASLDILFNNAALMKKERTITPDGFETMFQINFIGPYILSKGLVGLLQKNTPAQIINIAVPPDKMRINFDDLQFVHKFKTLDAFFQTKLYLLLFTQNFSHRLSGSGVIVNSLDPGPFRSNISREAPGLLRLMFNFVSTSAENASHYVQNLAEKADLPEISGKVFVKDNEKPLTDYWLDGAVQERLLKEIESLLSPFIKN
jgi:NAD(P)-dependent dehydrogenase (short-subunit alcohol dehydrogenase family)